MANGLARSAPGADGEAARRKVREQREASARKARAAAIAVAPGARPRRIPLTIYEHAPLRTSLGLIAASPFSLLIAGLEYVAERVAYWDPVLRRNIIYWRHPLSWIAVPIWMAFLMLALIVIIPLHGGIPRLSKSL